MPVVKALKARQVGRPNVALKQEVTARGSCPSRMVLSHEVLTPFPPQLSHGSLAKRLSEVEVVV